jgi:hypothetical protein
MLLASNTLDEEGWIHVQRHRREQTSHRGYCRPYRGGSQVHNREYIRQRPSQWDIRSTERQQGYTQQAQEQGAPSINPIPPRATILQEGTPSPPTGISNAGISAGSPILATIDNLEAFIAKIDQDCDIDIDIPKRVPLSIVSAPIQNTGRQGEIPQESTPARNTSNSIVLDITFAATIRETISTGSRISLSAISDSPNSPQQDEEQFKDANQLQLPPVTSEREDLGPRPATGDASQPLLPSPTAPMLSSTSHSTRLRQIQFEARMNATVVRHLESMTRQRDLSPSSSAPDSSLTGTKAAARSQGQPYVAELNTSPSHDVWGFLRSALISTRGDAISNPSPN